MAINDLGYREWNLDPTRERQQWKTIAGFGIRVAWRSTWLRRIFIMAWVPIFIMGAGLFVIEQSIQDIDSDEFPQNVGRFFVATLVYQRPEISNLTMMTQFSKYGDDLTEFLSGLTSGAGFSDGEGGPQKPRPTSQRQIMQQGLDFEIKDLQFVISLSDEQLKLAYEYINNSMMEQYTRSIQQRRRGPAMPLFKPSFSSIKHAQRVAGDLLEFDQDGNEVIDFRELVNYLRPTLWSEVLFLFFRLPQAFNVVIVIGMVAPKLISRDMKNRAFLLYYSRPITPWQYVLGKCAVVWAFLAGLTTLPALMLYILGLSLSPDLSVLAYTWHLPFKILIASIILCVPTTLFALTLSSLTRESRLASFGWFAVWIMGSVAYTIMTAVEAFLSLQEQQNSIPSEQAIVLVEAGMAGRWAWLSPMQTLENMQSWVFGIEKEIGSLNVSFFMVGLICLSCLLLLRRRVDAPIRV
ncbi:MAG: ABC transporter permease subunit [Planctomycetaceae bacterium]